VQVIDVQLVAQLCAATGYPRWRAAVERDWQRQNKRCGSRWTTAQWPRTLTEDQIAVLLIPLPAGRVGLAARGPRPIADPIFSSGLPLPGAPLTDGVLEALITWTGNPSRGFTARLAPPVIETILAGKVAERSVETFGLHWPLPVADGI